MFKLIATTLLATAAMIGAAQASEVDAYQTCWSEAAMVQLDNVEVTAERLRVAVLAAKGQCQLARTGAIIETSLEEVEEMDAYMEVQLYNANPVQETQTASAEPSMKPYAAPAYPARTRKANGRPQTLRNCRSFPASFSTPCRPSLSGARTLRVKAA